MGRKLVSVAELDRSLNDASVLRALGRIWHEEGYDLVVGQEYSADADVCILHHDRSILDAARLPEPPPSKRVVNGGVLDISKRRYSVLAVKPDDRWSGPVIVKTNLNHFGIPERQFGGRLPIGRRLRARVARRAWRIARMLPDRRYPVLERISKVPGWVWRSPDLIVEKFMPERDGDFYCLRGWLFLGSRGYAYRMVAADPMVKTGTMIRYEIFEDAPPEMHAMREQLGFDYGKFDYVVHDDRPILLDANKTPTFRGDPDSPHLRELAMGIEEFLS